jgi:hypothetical protein
MRFITKIWLVLLAGALVHSAARAATFSASLDRDTITLGEQASLQLTFEGVQPQEPPTLPAIPGLQIQYVGSSSSFQMINGQNSSSINFNYVVTAQHDGTFKIPGLRTTLEGQNLTTQPLKLVVRKASAPTAGEVAAGREPAFLKLLVPKDKVYVGEPMVAQLELYLRDDVQDLRGIQPSNLPTDGFTAGKLMIQQGQRHRAQVGNRVYTVFPLTLPLTATRTGNLTVGPVTATVSLVLASPNDGGDMMLFFNHGQAKQLAVTTESAAVQVLPLPEENKPADYSGAVGNFTMAVSAGPTNLTVGDPITVRVQIAGHGAFDTVTPPAQNAWSGFKTFPATTKLETSDEYGFQGTKTFEQIVSPDNADIHELPMLSFSFFNPEDGQYHTLTQVALPLTVKAAGATPVPTLAANNKAAAPENQSPVDIGPIKEKLGTVSRDGAPLVAQPVFLAVQSVPVLAFLATLVWRKRTDSLANNPRLRRHRAVARLVATGLVELKQQAAANQPDEFFANLFRLMQEQLGERLDCPASAITENVVEEQACLLAAPAPLRDALREQFQLCNQARYAPVRGASELNSVAAKFEQLIHDLQELKA